MSKTKAVETKIQAVSPVSNTASGSCSFGACCTCCYSCNFCCICCFDRRCFDSGSSTATSEVGVVAVAASSAQATEPPRSAPDRLSAK